MKQFNLCLTLFISIFTIFTGVQSFAQSGAAINTTGASPDPSAGLDIQFSNKGILIPRMTTLERNAISNPASGLQIYNTTTKCFEYFEYGVWQTYACAACPSQSTPTASTHTPSDYQIIWNWNTVSLATGYKYNTVNDYVTAIDNSSSTSYTQTGLNCGTAYTLYIWAYNICGNYSSATVLTESTTGVMPSAPSAGTHSPAPSAITWNWNTVAGATGYKFNTINDYGSATDNGTNTSYNQTGLNCNTAYNLYVWSYSVCAHSSVATLSSSTTACPFFCGTSTVTFTYRGGSVTYGTALNSTTNECWLDRNLGALQVATSYNDADAYGDLFQWGRLDDGHQVRTSSTTSTISNNDVPGHSNYICSYDDWRSPQNNALWQGASGINNPCPNGWRLATETELNNELTSWSQNNNTGAFASPLKFTAAGYRDLGIGEIFDGAISGGNYYSSTVNGAPARYLAFSSTNAIMYNMYRAHGASVRCIKD